jgi:small subunit ribosomal protein S20
LRSSKKRLVQSRKAQIRNRAVRSRMRSAIKAVRQATDRAAAAEALATAVSIIDKSAKRRVVPRNAAARYKSRLTKRVQALA